MKASKAKYLILFALYNFHEQRPSKYDFALLSGILNQVEITDMDFARSVINSLYEDGHLEIKKYPNPNATGARITKKGIDLLNEISASNAGLLHIIKKIIWPKEFIKKVMVIVVAGIILGAITFLSSLYIAPRFLKSEPHKPEIQTNQTTNSFNQSKKTESHPKTK